MQDPGADDRCTRRAMLRAAAGAGAATLLSPPSGVSAATAGTGPLGRNTAAAATTFSQVIGRVMGRTGPLAAPHRFVLAGVEWDGSPAVDIELRVRTLGGGWSRWGHAATLGHGPDRAPAGPPWIGEPLWTGPAHQFELRSDQQVEGVRLHFVDVPVGPRAVAARSLPLAQPRLATSSGQPPIIARSVWAGADAPPALTPGYGEVKLAFVHHTDNLNVYSAGEVPAMLLAIYQFHRYTRGWHDIGYNFVIDLYGRIWEARAGGIDEPVVGAQAGGYNLESTGVAILGTFSDMLPTPQALQALERLLAWKLALHGLPTHGHVTVAVDPADSFYTPFRPGQHVSLPRIAGHRQGDSTDCPGNTLFAHLPSVRARATALAGSVARITLDSPARVVVAGVPTKLSGRLTLLDGRPIAAAPVGVQLLHASTSGHRTPTIATALTDAAGHWSAAVELEQSARARVVHGVRPATVSALVDLPVAPQITLQVGQGASPVVNGTIRPAKATVTVGLFAVRGGRRVRLARRRLAVRGGRFSISLGRLAAGRYDVEAHSAPDEHNAAGASAPLVITVP